jgi:hypothetical protein
MGDKNAELLLLVARKLEDDPGGGAVKVNKAIWWADVVHFRETGRQISRGDHQKLPHGPAPRWLVPVRDKLVAEGSLAVREERFFGQRLYRLVPLRDPDLADFTELELEAVEQAVGEVRRMTGADASNRTHDEAGWRFVELHETIPMSTAYVPARQQEPTEEQRRRGLEIARRHGVA